MITNVLAEHGFEPWRDDAGAIMLRNCPFHQLAARYPGGAYRWERHDVPVGR